mgnify:CR=1 FL=1
MKNIPHTIIAILLLLPEMLYAQTPAFTPERKLRYAEQIIENFYLENPDTTKMVEDAIVAMLKTLDPHSTYSNAEETRELTEPLDGGFSGIGIRFQMLGDTLSVVEVISGGPSESSGLLAGDKIIACNDSVISGAKKKNSQIMSILRGPKGTVANLKVLRKGSSEPIDFRVIRDDIPIYSVDACYMADANTGYIRIARFAESTSKEVAEAMKTLRKDGMKNVIIDLTDNGGGYLRPAYEIANMFLRKGDKLVYTDSPRGGRHDYVAEENGKFLDGKVVIMANQFSASASEILSGAIQDNDRGAIVGRRTFGKGLVQRPFPFPDGSMMRLTIAHYYTPTGRDIQKPYTKGQGDAYAKDILTRYNQGELMHADSIHYADSLRVNTLRFGRPIYGGGGISPDVFVPLDTTFYSDYYRDLNAKGLVNQFAIRYTDANRKAIKQQYKNAEAFEKNFVVTNQMVDDLVALAEKEGVKPRPEGLERSRTTIENVVKAIVARDVYGDDDLFFRILNSNNDIYREALRLIQSPDYDRLLSAPQQ